MEKGMEKGIAQGIGQGQARLLKLMMKNRFGALSAEVEARWQEATPEQLEIWALRMLTADSMEEVFDAGGEPELRPH